MYVLIGRGGRNLTFMRHKLLFCEKMVKICAHLPKLSQN